MCAASISSACAQSTSTSTASMAVTTYRYLESLLACPCPGVFSGFDHAESVEPRRLRQMKISKTEGEVKEMSWFESDPNPCRYEGNIPPLTAVPLSIVSLTLTWRSLPGRWPCAGSTNAAVFATRRCGAAHGNLPDTTRGARDLAHTGRYQVDQDSIMYTQ